MRTRRPAGAPSLHRKLAAHVCLLAVISCGEYSDHGEKASALGKTEQAWTAHRFGIYAAKEYQGGWLATLAFQWTGTTEFDNNLDDTDTDTFYFQLSVPAHTYWYDPLHDGAGNDGSAGGLDTVDLFLTATHGGFTDAAHQFYEWDHNYSVQSNRMRLGDDNRKLSIFSAYSCNSVQIDEHMWERWGNAFRGGLRIALGAPALMGGGDGEHVFGNAYADALQSSWTVLSAWQYGVTRATPTNPHSGMATGSSEQDCTTRLYNITWQNFNDSAYPRLRDGAIAYYCWYVMYDDE